MLRDTQQDLQIGMTSPSPLDTTIAVVTPENIAFEYQLAGPFRRLPAYLIDLALRWGIIILALFLFLLIGGLLEFGIGPGFAVTGFAFWMILQFVVTWLYGTLMESYFNGRTVGKWACGIRAIGVDGRPITGKAAVLRNLIRIADLAPLAMANQFDILPADTPALFIIPTGIAGVISMMFTTRMQRLGDLAGGTMVIVDEKTWRLPIAKVDDPRAEALSTFIPGDYRVSRSMARTLAIYAERRHYLNPKRRQEISRHLAEPLIERFEFRRDIDPDLLLYCLYFKTFLADGRSTPDLGPLAGFSPLLKDASKIQSTSTPASLLVQNSIQPILESQPQTTSALPNEFDKGTGQ